MDNIHEFRNFGETFSQWKWLKFTKQYYNDDKLVIRLTFIHMKVGI